MRSIVLAVVFLLSTQTLAIADEQCEIRFVDENNKPLQNASFYFSELHGEKLVKAIYRDHKMDATASIKLAAIPAEFMFGVETQDCFYTHFWDQTEKPLVAGLNVIRVEQTGSLSLVFSHVDKDVSSIRDKNGNTSPRSLVMFVSRRDGDGEWESVFGAGRIGFRAGPPPWRIDGLAPGSYKCQLVDADDLKKGDLSVTYWSFEDIIVSKGNVSRMEGLKALAPR